VLLPAAGDGDTLSSIARMIEGWNSDEDDAELGMDEVDTTFFETIASVVYDPVTPPPQQTRNCAPPAPISQYAASVGGSAEQLCFPEPTWQNLLIEKMAHNINPASGTQKYRLEAANDLLKELKTMIWKTSVHKEKIKNETKFDRQKVVWAKHKVFLDALFGALDAPSHLSKDMIDGLAAIYSELVSQ
jgi:hypothetical protein